MAAGFGGFGSHLWTIIEPWLVAITKYFKYSNSNMSVMKSSGFNLRSLKWQIGSMFCHGEADVLNS